MGVTVENGKFRARYMHKGVQYNVGRYETEDEAWIELGRHKWENEKFPSFEWEKPVEIKLRKKKPSLLKRIFKGKRKK